jgi:hypothetical protein
LQDDLKLSKEELLNAKKQLVEMELKKNNDSKKFDPVIQ